MPQPTGLNRETMFGYVGRVSQSKKGYWYVDIVTSSGNFSLAIDDKLFPDKPAVGTWGKIEVGWVPAYYFDKDGNTRVQSARNLQTSQLQWQGWFLGIA